MSEIKKKKNTNHDHDKYITTPEFTKLTSANFCCKISTSKLRKQSDIANFVKKTDFYDKQSLK